MTKCDTEMSWTEMHIEDEAGNKGFRVSASPMSAPGQLRELRRHLESIKTGHSLYSRCGLQQNAFIMIDGQRELTDDELMAALLE